MRFFFTAVFVSLFGGLAMGQTNLSGTIATDSTLTLANSPYVVVSTLTIQPGYTLTVDSGVVIRFMTGVALTANGNIVARWATFTSNKDTAGGTPQKGDWSGIQIGSYSASPNATFDSCLISFGGSNGNASLYIYSGNVTINGNGAAVTTSSTRGVYVGSGSLSMGNAVISNCTGNGLEFTTGTTITFSSSSISSCPWPIQENGNASLVFNGVNTFSGNTHNGIYMNYYSTNSMVLDTVSIPYVFPGDFTVNAGQTLQIASTNILKFNGGHLVVNGALVAIAGVGESIYFTSYKDDNLGGDTNGDGSGTQPQTNNWYGVAFNDISMDSISVMRRCTVTFAGAGSTGGITMYNASPMIDSCSMANNHFGAMMQGASNPVFTNNTIGSSELVPIAMSFDANPVFSNNSFSFSDNTYDAIGLLGGTLTTDATLPIRSVTSIPNVTYLLLDYVVVPVGKTMTINKGIVIKGYQYYQRIVVQGKLVANASADSMIVFTSAKDDNFGNPGDSNKDGNATTPQVGDWAGIVFEPGSDTASVMNYCRVTYASLSPYYLYYYNSTYYYQGEITTINASPTISNCQIGNSVYGIYAALSSKPKILNNSIFNSQYTPIAMSFSADPTFTGNTFTNAGWVALGLIGEYVASTGTVKQRTVAGYANITYVLLADATINSGTNVTVDAGIVIKSNGPGLYVNGGFKAKGTMAGGQVVFTSLKDDNFGNPGDTNGDGAATSPAAGNWSTIRYQATSDDGFCLLDSCLVKFGGSSSWGAVTFTDAGGVVSNSTLSDSYNYGVRCENSSTPLVNNVTIANCRLDPIAMSLLSNPTFTNITFSANGSNGIRILEGTLSSNASLITRSMAGIANIAYIIDNLTIASSAVLTINPGVVMKFSSYYASITVNGALVADGTATAPIVFTSFKDDSNGGDTNNDGNSSTPNRGDWNTADFNASSLDSLNSLKHCDFRYGGSNYYEYYYRYGEMRVFNAALKADSCIFEQSNTAGIGSFGSAHPTISNSQINNVNSTPVSMSMFSTPTFTNNSAQNVGYMALGIVPETYSVNATVPIRDFAGYTNITYYMYSTCTINTGTVITIPAGVVFKGGGWTIDGAIAVAGTSGQPVVFTDPRDDNYGNPGDTNGDGSATQPGIASGNRFYFDDVSTDSLSTVRHALFRYTDIGIYLQQAGPNVNNCTFDHTNWGLFLNGVSNPALDSCLFRDLTYGPFETSLVSYPRSTLADSITGTTYRAIGVISETLVQDVTLPKRNFAGRTNIPYVFANYTVASNAVLTVAPGVVLKFFPGNGMTVNKGLIAVGGPTPDSTIVFTDLRDDFYGGDTNADSANSTPTVFTYPQYWYPGWSGISFADQSLDNLCQLSHCIIRYAGLNYSGAAITTTNASPTITYCSITNNYDGIKAGGASNPVVNYSDIYGNSGDGVNNVNKSFNIDARWNWWGSNTGPTHASNPGGTGQSITDSVRYSPYLGSGASNPIEGDVSLNGAVQAYDGSLILKYVVNPTGPDSLNEIQLRVADVSGASGVTAYDASLVLQYVVGLISGFPAEASGNMKQLSPATRDQLVLQKVSGVRLALASASVDRGDSVVVPVNLMNVDGVTSVQVTVKYDPKIFAFEKVTTGEINEGFSMAFSNDKERGILNVAMAGARVLNTDGAVALMQFRASDDVSGKVNSPITIVRFMANESDLTKLTSAGQVEVLGRPTSFALEQNYPNPFNPSTTIQYQLPDDNTRVRVVIYNILGQTVKTLVNDTKRAGVYKAVWNGTNDHGIQVSSGTYFYRIEAGKFVQTKKLVLIR